jgi:hydrogenase maturation protease
VRVHLGVGESDAGTKCRTLVGGLGMPGLRDLDFGRQVVGYLQHLDWPEAVTVEDLACSAHLVLDRLKELRPAKVVVVGSAARGSDPPGTLRRYQLDLTAPPPGRVHQGLTDSLGEMTDLDHTLAVVRHWGGFPVDTIVIEVEPLDCGFGPGFSEELGDCIEPILAMVREELACDSQAGVAEHPLSVEDALADDQPALSRDEQWSPGIPSGLEQMADQARAHALLGRLEPYRNAPVATRLGGRCPISIEARTRPFGVGLRTGGDWYDVIPRSDGTFGVLLGDAVGRGSEGAAIMSELRAAVRAYAVLDDDTPSRLLTRIDHLVGVTGMGQGSALAYLHVAPGSGRVRMSNAGQCPPLVSTGTGWASFAGPADSLPLGAGDSQREEIDFVLHPSSTLYLFTAGLARSGRRSMAEGLEWVRTAASRSPRPLEAACDFVFNACLDRRPREDDAMIVALRLHPDPAGAPAVMPTPSTAT